MHISVKGCTSLQRGAVGLRHVLQAVPQDLLRGGQVLLDGGFSTLIPGELGVVPLEPVMAVERLLVEVTDCQRANHSQEVFPLLHSK